MSDGGGGTCVQLFHQNTGGLDLNLNLQSGQVKHAYLGPACDNQAGRQTQREQMSDPTPSSLNLRESTKEHREMSVVGGFSLPSFISVYCLPLLDRVGLLRPDEVKVSVCIYG